MNPNPLLALNHFTVPCSFTDLLFLFELFGASRPPPAVKQKEAASVNLQPLQSNLKVLQEQQTQRLRARGGIAVAIVGCRAPGV
jgi:hypothetical protein